MNTSASVTVKAVFSRTLKRTCAPEESIDSRCWVAYYNQWSVLRAYSRRNTCGKHLSRTVSIPCGFPGRQRSCFKRWRIRDLEEAPSINCACRAHDRNHPLIQALTPQSFDVAEKSDLQLHTACIVRADTSTLLRRTRETRCPY